MVQVQLLNLAYNLTYLTCSIISTPHHIPYHYELHRFLYKVYKYCTTPSLVQVGKSDPSYPIQKKRVSREFLRTKAHLRPRTNTFGAVSRCFLAMRALFFDIELHVSRV